MKIIHQKVAPMYLLQLPLRNIAILLAMLYIFAPSVDARTVSVEEAMVKAQRFYANAKDPALRIKGTATTFKLAYEAKTSAKTASCFYVLNQSPSKGFIIISADDRLPEVLGYSDSGDFDIDQIPDNMKWWLSEYERQIEQVLSSSSADDIASTEHREGWTPIEPLVKTKWYQYAPYNNLCPTVDGQRCVTGCVATAMAQIMDYHQWPLTGKGSNSYEWSGQTYSMDFSEVTFDWENMQDTYSGTSDSPEAQKAVATLMLACGISLNMCYGVSESVSSSYLIEKALLNHFDYNAHYLNRDIGHVEFSDWETLIYEELTNNRPVCYGGSSVGGGHSFVCDGYSIDGLFHFNWGWGGADDGYFSILNGPDGWVYNHEIIYGIQPIERAEVNGVSYDLTKKENKAFVNVLNEGDYTGELIIPESVSYENKEYAVVGIRDSVRHHHKDLISFAVYAPIDEVWFPYPDTSSIESHKLETIILQNTVPFKIREQAFQVCINLTTLKLGDNLEEIGNWAFHWCHALPELTIPDNVKSIGYCAFSGCYNLKTLKLGSKLEFIGDYAFVGCRNLSELVIPNGVTYLGEYAFGDCGNLQELIIPNSVIFIGDNAFYACNELKKLVIGSNVTSIGDKAFFSTKGRFAVLSSITSLNTTPPMIEVGTFSEEAQKSATLHVPKGYKEVYLQADYWKEFVNIVDDVPTDIESVTADKQQKENNAIYSLEGIKLSTSNLSDLPAGIYIVNGKKVMVK